MPRAQNLLIGELETLERFQPTDPNLNIRQISSFEYFVKKHYRPKENMVDFIPSSGTVLYERKEPVGPMVSFHHSML